MMMMPSAMLIVWLTPVAIEGTAWGSCTLNRIWRRDEPNTVPASTVSDGTPTDAERREAHDRRQGSR